MHQSSLRVIFRVLFYFLQIYLTQRNEIYENRSGIFPETFLKAKRAQRPNYELYADSVKQFYKLKSRIDDIFMILFKKLHSILSTLPFYSNTTPNR